MQVLLQSEHVWSCKACARLADGFVSEGDWQTKRASHWLCALRPFSPIRGLWLRGAMRSFVEAEEALMHISPT